MSCCAHRNIQGRTFSSQDCKAKKRQASLSKIIKFLSVTCFPISTTVARVGDILSWCKEGLESILRLLRNGVYAVTVGAFVSGLDLLDDTARDSASPDIPQGAQEALGMLERNGFLRAWVKYTDGVDGSSRQVVVTLSKTRRMRYHEGAEGGEANRSSPCQGEDCFVCMDATADATLQPCGHSQLCRRCAVVLVVRREKQTAPACPYCRAPITHVTIAESE
eukprot:765767-Hanusia_phi.AAC.3